MLEIVFLGTGSGIPSKNRAPPAIWIQYGPDCMLWDCGEGTQRQLMAARLSFMKLSRIFITHWHADHWAGLIGLMQTMNMEGRKTPLHIYGPDAERFVGDLLDLDYWGPRFRIISHNVPYEGSEPAHVYESSEYVILSIPAEHTVPAVAYAFQEREKWNVDIKKAEKLFGLKQSPLVGRLKKEGRVIWKGKSIALKDVGYKKPAIKVVYTGDTRICSNIEKLSGKSDILIHDSTFMEETENRMHSDVRSAARMARRAGVRSLILTHFSRRYQDTKPLRDEALKIFPSTKTARDFMRIVLKKQADKPPAIKFIYK